MLPSGSRVVLSEPDGDLNPDRRGRHGTRPAESETDSVAPRDVPDVAERAVLSCPNGALLGASAFEPGLRLRGGVATPETLQPTRATTRPPASHSIAPSDLGDQVRDLERRIISAALTRFDGNKSKAARHLGITRNGLALKMRRLGIPSTRDDQAL